MSRAFVDEDAEREEELPDLPIPLPAGAKNYMTGEGAAGQAAELRSLADEIRPHMAARLAAAEAEPSAASPGSPDSPEALRRSLAETDRRIRYLVRMASLVEVVEPPREPERASFGLWIDVEEEGGETRSYRIVGVDESDPERGLVSWPSPIARSLIGKRPGETALARLPGGEKRMRIVAVRSGG
jgi:transcription elongation factor GreB